MESKPQKQTFMGQLTEGGFLWFWVGLLIVFLIASAGLIFDLEEPFIFGQGLDKGSCRATFWVCVVLTAIILLIVRFNREMVAKREGRSL